MTRLPALLLLAALAVATDAVAQQPPLGRLFYTPEQRAALDRQRLHSHPGAEDDSSPLTLNGKVTRSSGKNTSWVNGVQMDDREAESLGRVPRRPGETIRGPGSGETTDLLNGGTIVIKRNPPRP